jgi:FAD-linked sulfhydryl oxidase
MVTQRAKPNANPAVNASSAPGSTAATTATTAVAATAAAATTALDDSECPPDVQQLGRSTWTLLHSIAATYPDHPTIEQKIDLTQFMTSFSKLYPCTSCARGLRKHMEKEKLKVTNRDEFGKWLCDAHNIVNVRTGKPTFDCQLWKERWKDGWKDGRCD